MSSAPSHWSTSGATSRPKSFSSRHPTLGPRPVTSTRKSDFLKVPVDAELPGPAGAG